jgi:hypothetical protein
MKDLPERLGSRGPARILWSLSLALVALSVASWPLNHLGLRDIAADGSQLSVTLIALTFPTVGILIALRQPRNPVGWLFYGAGVIEGLNAVIGAYSLYARDGAHGLPLGDWAAWLDSFIWIPGLSMVVLLLLLFPNGRLPSPRWRWAVRLTAAGAGLAMIGFAFHPGKLDGEGVKVQNPLGAPADLKGALNAALAVGALVVLICMLASLVAVVRRFRTAKGRERLQLKWFTYSAVLFALLVVGTINVSSGVLLGVIEAVVIGPLLAVAVGIAMLRHRLYDIDAVINRTLVYGALTAALAGVYLGSVLLLQLALGSVTADSSLAVAVSTLGVAALFRPVRGRIQAAVDRRFYRRKYDAARTLQRFSARLREQVDLDTLGDELRRVVWETMQRAHVSLWLRGPEVRR